MTPDSLTGSKQLEEHWGQQTRDDGETDGEDSVHGGARVIAGRYYTTRSHGPRIEIISPRDTASGATPVKLKGG